MKKDSEDGPDVKGGELDALIVHATKVQKFSENGNCCCHSIYFDASSTLIPCAAVNLLILLVFVF